MDHATMVTIIKGMQRDDQVAKEQWWALCDHTGGGVRDPAKHDDAFLLTFIRKFQAGERFEVPLAAGPGNLGEMFKEFQRKSKSFKEAWATYCDLHGTGKHDPNKQTQEFLVGFIDFLSRQGSMALAMLGGAQMPGMGGMGLMQGPDENPAKRPRTGDLPIMAPLMFGQGGPMGMGSSQSMDPAKDSLVQRIKQFQRSGEHQKQTWWTYADTMKGGVRDPAKHDMTSLQEFISQNGVP